MQLAMAHASIQRYACYLRFKGLYCFEKYNLGRLHGLALDNFNIRMCLQSRGQESKLS